MPFEMKAEGMEDLSEYLNRLEESAPAMAKKALYVGAGIMAEEIRKEIGKIKTAEFKYASGSEKRLPSPEEKAALENAPIGIAKFNANGAEVDTSVGFNDAGYVNVNFKHMSSQGRTNYKAVYIKGHESSASSLLHAIGVGKGAQNQKPVGVLANSINSGTSFMERQPFIRKAVKSGSTKAMQAMKEAMEAEVSAMTK